MKRYLITFALVLASTLAFGQKLNQYQYIIFMPTEINERNGYQDFLITLAGKGFKIIKEVTADIPADQVVSCQVRDWHTGFGGRCTVKFFDLNFQPVVDFSCSTTMGWGPSQDMSLVWKNMNKKIKKYPYKFNPIVHFDNSPSNVIAMEKKNGEYWIDCKVNGVPMKFIFDTGATSVSLSKVEAMFLIKNGSLSEDDIVGAVNTTIADGSITTNTRVILRKLQIGPYLLRNIEAVVSDNETAPLLLGQSALSQLGKINVDFNNNTITVVKE